MKVTLIRCEELYNYLFTRETVYQLIVKFTYHITYNFLIDFT